MYCTSGSWILIHGIIHSLYHKIIFSLTEDVPALRIHCMGTEKMMAYNCLPNMQKS